ncbi:hypothetical protein [Novosphingobium sp. KA1]|uniref:hypothetical protein n=1 Tax=Novosphingobium sp. (strain KA1) TaxID=164608 RepID=UPI001A8CB8A5|nr:hypothetical protein [Novosphingobium sp. KA1]QSR18068.1 hypothetical protein CA833_12855 [Novosphingobium sp. KA1]
MNIRTLAAPLSLSVALALGLSACQKQPQPEATATSEAPVEEVATQAAPAPLPTAIPEGLRGRWGMVEADCTSTAGDAKGLLVIDDKRLTFYEAVASLGTIKSASANAIEADFAFSGEGQSWNLDVALSSPDGGRTLVRKDTGPDAAPGTLTYKKCA